MLENSPSLERVMPQPFLGPSNDFSDKTSPKSHFRGGRGPRFVVYIPLSSDLLKIH